MIIIKGLSKWILPVYQPYVRDYSHRLEVYYGGAGSGKSHFATQKLALKACQSKRKILVIRKVGNTLRDSVWSVFLTVLNQLKCIQSLNKSEYTITLINGSVFIFKGLDDQEKIKSISGITDIFIEEATELTLDDFTQLNLRLRSNVPDNQIIIAFNPVSKANWVYKYFFEFGKPADCFILQTTYADNPYLPQAYIDSLNELKSRNPAFYRIYVLGEFATLDKLVFPIYHKEIIKEEDVKGLLFWCGLDFGYANDPTAITWGYFNPVGKILYITGEYNKVGLTNDIVAETLIKLGLNRTKIIADSAEKKSIDEIRKFGIKMLPAEKGAGSILNGLDKLQRCEIHIDERCVHVIEEFENYTWMKDKKTNEYKNEPIDDFNHHIDSIRYGIQLVIGKKTAEKYVSLY